MKIKRSGFVYKLYLKNIIALWGLALILFAGLMYILCHNTGYNYLANYLFYRKAPDPAALTEFTARDMLDMDYVMADIEAHGGNEALNRSLSCFYKPNLYQEGSRYRFQITIDPDKLTDTGIYYDCQYNAFQAETRDQARAQINPEDYITEHLYFYEYQGMNYVLLLGDDVDLEEKMRVTFAPMGVYALYIPYDLYRFGYQDSISNYFIDVSQTPVDPEDEIFKDLCLYAPFALAAMIAAILLTIVPTLHPTYRQLAKYGRTIQKAVEKVDKDYEEFGIESEGNKTLYLNDWLVKKSTFKNGIEKNYKKQKN